MKFKSALLTSASGSVGGMTASRNRGGMFLRARVIPVNPNTEAQGNARAAMATCVGVWSSTLSPSERGAWNAYAQNTPVVDVLGDQLILTGQQMFSKCNIPRINAGLPVVQSGPSISGLATTPVMEPFVWNDEGPLTGTVNVLDAGITGDLITYVSEPASPARSLAHQRRRLVGVDGPPVAGAFTVSFPNTEIPWTPLIGNSVRITVLYLGDDGRISSEVFQDVVITVTP